MVQQDMINKPAFGYASCIPVAIKYRYILDLIFLHQGNGFHYGLFRGYRNKPQPAAAVDYVAAGFHVQESSFQHPFVIIYLAHIAASMVVEYANNHIVFFSTGPLNYTHPGCSFPRCNRKTAPFFFGQPAGHYRAILIRDLGERIDIPYIVIPGTKSSQILR